MSSARVHVFYPLAFWDRGPRRTCYNICRHWPGQGLETRIHTPACLHADPAGVMAPALPQILPLPLRRRLAALPALDGRLARLSMRRGLAAVRPGDICYFWPGAPLEAMKTARDRGGRVVLEFINTHNAYAKAILDAECDRVGAPRYRHFTPARIGYDRDRVALAEAIFTPGPFVGPSIAADAAQPPPFLDASYGTHLPVPAGSPRAGARPDRKLRFLFVGFLGVRKGTHTLLEAWARAGLPAELWLAGAAEPGLPDGFLPDGGPSVRRLGHVADMDRLYREADVFVFPSLEEGGPQVVYEAASYGLPLAVTPMGGGWIAREEETALIVPPGDAEALAAALVRLHDDDALREHLSAGALAAAPDYRWEAVAGRRRDALQAFTAAG